MCVCLCCAGAVCAGCWGVAVAGAADDTGNVVGREVAHPDAHETWVTVQQLQRGMCGDSRPHFFRGVATVGVPLCVVVTDTSSRAPLLLEHSACVGGPCTQAASMCADHCACRCLQVVTKLFHIVEPDVACFGQKDYQQWRLITRMVRMGLAHRSYCFVEGAFVCAPAFHLT